MGFCPRREHWAGDILGPVPSLPALLAVLINPVIIAQPLSQEAVIGGNVTMSVGITGNPAPFTFEWRRGAMVFWTNVTSEPMSFLTLTNVQANDAALYRVVIKNAANSQPGIISSNAFLSVLADTDGDGLPDDWEIAHGLSAADPTDALQDLDEDGVSTLDEYRCGTDPGDAGSYLRVESFARDGDNASMQLRFWAASNRTYSVESRLSAVTGTWQRFSDFPAAGTNRWVEKLVVLDGGMTARVFRLVSPRRP